VREILNYKNLFIDEEELSSSVKRSNYEFLRIFHNCDPGSERLRITFFNHLNSQYCDDFFVIEQETFNAIQPVFEEIIVSFDELSSINPLKGYGMLRARIICDSIIGDLQKGIVTFKLKHYLRYFSASLFDESVKLCWHTADGNVHRDDEKYWSLIFKHRDRIIDFYNAFFYFIFDVMNCDPNTFDDLTLINIDGY
jgi:hypothetical protein